jgi:hypothetical protein
MEASSWSDRVGLQGGSDPRLLCESVARKRSRVDKLVMAHDGLGGCLASNGPAWRSYSFVAPPQQISGSNCWWFKI